jgi:hypothetical protein
MDEPSIPERIRLVKLLRAHGLRDVERLRQDELKEALHRLGLSADPKPVPPAELPPREGPWSATQARRAEQVPVDVGPPPQAESDGRDVRYDEPDVRVPHGRRTFVRLIAVEPGRLFATWDLSPDDRGAPGDARLEIRSVDGDAALRSIVVDRDAHRWYLDSPAEREGLYARLWIGDREVARGNACWPPPSQPAPPGRLVLATVPVDVDRRALRGGKLLASAALGQALPAGVTVDATGQIASAVAAPGDGPSSADNVAASSSSSAALARGGA